MHCNGWLTSTSRRGGLTSHKRRKPGQQEGVQIWVSCPDPKHDGGHTDQAIIGAQHPGTQPVGSL